MTRPLSIRQREALDRLLATRFPRADHREVIGNAMLVGACALVVLIAGAVVMFGGPA